MKLKVKIIFILCVLIYSESAFSKTEFTSFIDKRLKFIPKPETDTVILLSYSIYNSFSPADTAKGLRDMVIFRNTLLFYRNKSV